MKPHAYRILLVFALLIGLATGATAVAAQEWVARSDQASDIYLPLLAKYSPEAAGFWGVEGFDEDVTGLPLDLNTQSNADTQAALAKIRALLAEEDHPAVRQDLEILIATGEDSIEQTEIYERFMVPYFNIPGTVFQGLRALLDDQVAADRRPAALVRLRRYTGMDEGYEPLVDQAIAFTRAALKDPELLGPFAGEMERDIGNAPSYLDGIGKLFQKYEIEGWEEAHGLLGEQFERYATFLGEELGPRARADFRLPPEVYAVNLKGFGVDLPVNELVSRAKVSFREIQNEMQVVASFLAKERELPSSDYRDVIRELKKKQIVGDAILPHYRERGRQLEELVRKHDVVTLPEREMRIRIASEAEAAGTPAPNMRPPRLIGNTGEMGEFVLPLNIPGGEGSLAFDDFTFEAASWTLSVHEARPGHEMQFASMVEKGVSKARALFSLNSTNAEGWALYCEAEMKPYMPLDGQLISLQHRLLRAARAYLDPSLQMGDVTPEEVKRILLQEVGLSEAAATSEVQRYTFLAPGQATSYFTGYQRLMEIRTDAERIMGEKFDRRALHDFILAQGLLPLRLLRKAVMEEFVGAT